jgi:hypothetical protein
VCIDLGGSATVEVLEEVAEGIGRQRDGMDFGSQRLEEPTRQVSQDMRANVRMRVTSRSSYEFQ